MLLVRIASSIQSCNVLWTPHVVTLQIFVSPVLMAADILYEEESVRRIVLLGNFTLPCRLDKIIDDGEGHLDPPALAAPSSMH